MPLTQARRKTPGLSAHGVFLFLGATVLSIAACATDGPYKRLPTDSSYPAAFYITGVPFYPQEEFQCGPSVLASVLNFEGYRIAPEEISESVYSEGIKGTLTLDMVNFARHYTEKDRTSVIEVKGDIELIKKDITGGYPVIAFVDLGIWSIRKGHYMLIVGYDDVKGGIIAYSGLEKDRFLSYNQFMRMWERGGHWALRIIPR